MDDSKEHGHADANGGRKRDSSRRRGQDGADDQKRGPKGGARPASRNSNDDQPAEQSANGYARGDQYRGSGGYERRDGGRFYDEGYRGGARQQQPQGAQRGPRRDGPPAGQPAAAPRSSSQPPTRQPPIGNERAEGKPQSANIAEARRLQELVPQKGTDRQTLVEQVQAIVGSAIPSDMILDALVDCDDDVSRAVDHLTNHGGKPAPSAWTDVVKKGSHQEQARHPTQHAAHPAAGQHTAAAQQPQRPAPQQPPQQRPAQPQFNPAPGHHQAPPPHAHAQQHHAPVHTQHAPPVYVPVPQPPPVAVPPAPEPEPEPEPEPQPRPEEEVVQDLNTSIAARMQQMQETTRQLMEIQNELQTVTSAGNAEIARLREEKEQLAAERSRLEETLKQINQRLSSLDDDINYKQKDKAEKIRILQARSEALLGGAAPTMPMARMTTHQALQMVVPHLSVHPGQVMYGHGAIGHN